MERIMKIAKGLDITLKVVWILLWVAVGVEVIGACMFAVLADSFVGVIQEKGVISFPFGVVNLSPYQPVLTPGQYRGVALSFIATGLVIYVLGLIAVRQLRSITGDMRQGHPFSADTPRRIRRVAYIIFVFAIVSPLVQLIPAYAIARVLDLPQLIAPSSIAVAVRLTYSPNLPLIFIGFVVILLSFVFEYGARLQQESDETL